MRPISVAVFLAFYVLGLSSSDAQAVWDTEYQLYQVTVPPRATSTVEGVVLKAWIFPAASSRSFQLGAVRLPSSSRLVLEEATVEIPCDSWHEYTLVYESQVVILDGNVMFVPEVHTEQVSIQNSSFYCSADFPSWDEIPHEIRVDGTESFADAIAVLHEIDLSGQIKVDSPLITLTTPLYMRKLSISSLFPEKPTAFDMMNDGPVKSSLLDGGITLSNASLMNICLEGVQIIPGWPKAYTLLGYGFRFGPGYSNEARSQRGISLYMSGVDVIVGSAEFNMYLYWLVLTSMPPTQSTHFNLVEWILQIDSAEWDLENDLSFIFLFSNSSLLGYFSEVRFVATQGLSPGQQYLLPSVQQPATCDGETISEEEEFQSSWPLYKVTTSDGFLSALIDSLSSVGPQQPFKLVFSPLLLIFANVSLVAVEGSYAFIRDTIWSGPVPKGEVRPANSPEPRVSLWGPSSLGSMTNVFMDCAEAKGVIKLEGGVGMTLQHITLTNLPVSSETELALGFNNVKSALPLWMFSFNRAYASALLLHHITVVLPVEDFSILHALVQAGGLESLEKARSSYPESHAIHSKLIDRIKVFNATRFDRSHIMLTRYVGWGVNGSNVMFTSASPLAVQNGGEPPAPVLTPIKYPAVDEANPDTNNHVVPVAVSSGAGALLVFTGAVFTLVYFRRSKQQAKPPPHDMDLTFDTKENDASTLCFPQSPLASDRKVGQTSQVQTSQVQSSQVQSSQVQSSNVTISDSFNPLNDVQHLAGLLSNTGNGRLTLFSPIGRGAFGTVYQGRWLNLEVAVKTVLFTGKRLSLFPNSDKHEIFAEVSESRAVTEAAVCTSISHRNVVSTYHYEIKTVSVVGVKENSKCSMLNSGSTVVQENMCADYKLFLVQELCHASLADALVASLFHDKLKRPYMNLLLGIALDIASGMEYVHGKNIIHGDLKPENVLLKHDSSSPVGMVAKITDFGLCAAMTPGQSHISNYASGTPFYRAPEIGFQATQASDVYSFGILLVEMYRCMAPWVRTPHGFRPNKAFLPLPSTTPRRYAELCTACINLNPKERPSFQLLARELHSLYEKLLAGDSEWAISIMADPGSEAGSGSGSGSGSACSQLVVGPELEPGADATAGCSQLVVGRESDSGPGSSCPLPVGGPRSGAEVGSGSGCPPLGVASRPGAGVGSGSVSGCPLLGVPSRSEAGAGSGSGCPPLGVACGSGAGSVFLSVSACPPPGVRSGAGAGAGSVPACPMPGVKSGAGAGSVSGYSQLLISEQTAISAESPIQEEVHLAPEQVTTHLPSRSTITSAAQSSYTPLSSAAAGRLPQVLEAGSLEADAALFGCEDPIVAGHVSVKVSELLSLRGLKEQFLSSAQASQDSVMFL